MNGINPSSYFRQATESQVAASIGDPGKESGGLLNGTGDGDDSKSSAIPPKADANDTEKPAEEARCDSKQNFN